MINWHLYQVYIRLNCDGVVVQRYWQELLTGWLEGDSPQVMAQLQLELVETLPDLPDEPPFFVDHDDLLGGVGLLSVYGDGEDEVLLHFKEGAMVRVPLGEVRPFLTGQILAKAVSYGRLEDITFACLAPFLRRQGYYLIHAFGVCKDGRCLLFVGSSGSGKTTTGLSFVLAGWELLANDILLIEARGDGIYALPTPGGLSIREKTLTLLPDCQQFLGDMSCQQGKYNLTNQQVWNGRVPDAARVTAIYFCQIEERMVSEERPLSPAITLAQLMEQSTDIWDKPMLNAHMTILQNLSQQANCFTLHLGQDVPQIPTLLANKQ